jgi:hypothetical protein
MTQGSQPGFVPAQTSSLPAAPMPPGPIVAPSLETDVGKPQYDPHRYHQGATHTDFTPNNVHTSKCDNCDKRNSSVLQQCVIDGFNICMKCMYGPIENRKDGGIHFAPQDQLDWRTKDKTTKTQSQKRQRAPKSGLAKIVGKKPRRQREVLGSSGDTKPKNNSAEGMNDMIGMTESCSSERPGPAKKPLIPLQTEEGFFIPDKLVPYKDAIEVDNQNKIEMPTYHSPYLKRKLTTAEGLAPSKRGRLTVDPNNKLGVRREFPYQDNSIVDDDRTETDPDLTEEEEDPKRLGVNTSPTFDIYRQGRSGPIESQSTQNAPTWVQEQILGFLIENHSSREPVMLARYRDLLGQELRRVEEALELTRGARLPSSINF